MKTKSKILSVYIFCLVGIIIWIGAMFLAPYLRCESLPSNFFVYAIFSPVCHQIPSRSFHVFGYPLAVCVRCLGIYFGFFVGTALYPILQGFSSLTLPKNRAFLILSFPIVLDTIGNFFHIWSTSNGMRFAIGFLWGIILPFYFILGIADLILHFTQKKGRNKKSLEIPIQNKIE